VIRGLCNPVDAFNCDAARLDAAGLDDVILRTVVMMLARERPLGEVDPTRLSYAVRGGADAMAPRPAPLGPGRTGAFCKPFLQSLVAGCSSPEGAPNVFDREESSPHAGFIDHPTIRDFRHGVCLIVSATNEGDGRPRTRPGGSHDHDHDSLS
jgi:hypothetical protein